MECEKWTRIARASPGTSDYLEDDYLDGGQRPIDVDEKTESQDHERQPELDELDVSACNSDEDSTHGAADGK